MNRFKISDATVVLEQMPTCQTQSSRSALISTRRNAQEPNEPNAKGWVFVSVTALSAILICPKRQVVCVLEQIDLRDGLFKGGRT